MTQLSIQFNLKQGDFQLTVNLHSMALVTGLFGPSGAGKSSLLRVVAGLVTPDQGRIAIDNRLLYCSSQRINLAVHQRRIGFVFQEPHLFPHLSVRANLLYGYRRLLPKQRHIHLDDVVPLLELAQLLDKKPHCLSGGEKQRVGLGRALLSNPQLLLLDEPLASLDERLKYQILPFLLKIRDELHLPMLYVSHSLAEINYLTEHIVSIERGCIDGEILLPKKVSSR
jgi:molybdate transport system ATP-binding protein